MSESLSSRVGRIVSGSLNALVDAIEDAAPEAVMEQAIREIDHVIADARRELGQHEANHHLATKRQTEETQRLESLGNQARLALDSGREDLARVAVEQQIAIEDQLPVLAERIAELAEAKAKAEGYIRALQGKKREMREELARVREARRIAPRAEESSATAAAGGGDTERKIRADAAISAFDRVHERLTGLAGVGAADPDRAARLDQLESLSQANRVAERLARMKAETPR